MRIERIRPAVLRVTLHVSELSALIVAARLAVDDDPESLPEEARAQLRDVLASYDDARAGLAVQ